MGKESSIIRWFATRPLLVEIGLIALMVMFGLQVLRVFVPCMNWVLGSRLGWGALELGAVGIFVFGSAFLAGPLRRWVGSRRLIVGTVVGLGILRLSLQVWWGEPLFNLVLSMVATMCFIIFLPVYFKNALHRDGSMVKPFALGLLVGVTIDTAIHGVFSTYDISWRVEVLPLVVTIVCVAILFMLLVGMVSRYNVSKISEPSEEHSNSTRRSWAWLAIGPFIFLQLLIFQNIARLATLTGWPLPHAFGWTMAAHILGIVAAAWFLSKIRRSIWTVTALSGIGLVVVLALPTQNSGVTAPVTLLLGHVFVSLLIVILLSGIGAGVNTSRSSRLFVANGITMVLLLALFLFYYGVYDISLPYTNTILEPIAAVILVLCTISAMVKLRANISNVNRVWLVPITCLVLLIMPLARMVAWQPSTATGGEGFPVRVMTYNLHNGFNTDGHLDMNALVQVIEENNVDIVALQEVSRGWLINSRLDMLTMLSQKLGMPYVFGPTADPYWGSAVLSRYPIKDVTQHELPPRDLFLLRGFTAMSIELLNGNELNLIATHFHHLDNDTEIRQLQAEDILEFWGSADTTILLGDLNAESDSVEMEMFRDTGLIDVAALTQTPPAFTFPANNPDRRIDYIWTSPDLEVVSVWVPMTTASDHLPVAAIISK